MQNHIYMRKILIFSTSLKLYDIEEKIASQQSGRGNHFCLPEMRKGHPAIFANQSKLSGQHGDEVPGSQQLNSDQANSADQLV